MKFNFEVISSWHCSISLIISSTSKLYCFNYYARWIQLQLSFVSLYRHHAPYYTCVVVLYHMDLIPFIFLWIIWHNYIMHTSTFSICQEIKKFPHMHVLFNDYLTWTDVTSSMLFRSGCLNSTVFLKKFWLDCFP